MTCQHVSTSDEIISKSKVSGDEMSELGAAAPGRGRGRRDSAQQASQAFRSYYKETDIFLSAEGILKVISIIGCIVTSAVFLGGSPCSGAPGLVASAGSVALAGGAALALLYAGVALQASLSAPTTWLYTDIIVSSVVGVLLLLTGALALVLCAPAGGASHYVNGPLAMATAVLVMGSAVLTYARAMRRWDAARRAPPPRRPGQPPSPPPREHDV